MNSATTTTPAGAALTARRHGRWSTVTVDRSGIADATPTQQWWADGVALAATYSCWDRGRVDTIETMAGPVDWYAMCPREDESALVGAYLAVEAENFGPVAAYVLACTWQESPAFLGWAANAERYSGDAADVPSSTSPQPPVRSVLRRMALPVERRRDLVPIVDPASKDRP